MITASCVALVLLGNAPDDLQGVSHLCDSIFYYEPEVRHVVVVCDSLATMNESAGVLAAFGGRVGAILAPPKHPVTTQGKYLGANVLCGLDYIERCFDVDFVLKLDADSLVINSFAHKVSAFFSSNVDAGVCGTLGRTCSRDETTYGFEFRSISPFIRIIASKTKEQWADISLLTDRELAIYARSGTLSVAHLRAFSAIARPLFEAMRHGYSWLEYCQGGGYAISKRLLKAMRGKDYLGFSNATSLYGLPNGEDVLVSMYCRSLGLQVMDYSEAHQPFACTWLGLPYAPDVLLQRQHAIIHSLKGDRHSTRAELQSIFKALRMTPSRM